MPSPTAVYTTTYNATHGTLTATVTTAANDYVVVFFVAEGSSNGLGTLSGNSVSWGTPTTVGDSGNYGQCSAWTAQDTTGGTDWTLSITTNGTNHCGFVVYRYSSADVSGFGNISSGTGSGAPSLALTTAADNSAIAYANTDWNASGGTITWRTINSASPTQRVGYQGGTDYDVYSGDWSDAGTAGSKTTGLTAPSGQAYAAIAVEVQAAGGGTAHTREVTDSAGLVDTEILDRGLVVTDSSGSSDTLVASRDIVVTDAAGLDGSGEAFDLGIVITDDAGSTDGVTVVENGGFVDTENDSAGLVDTLVADLAKVLTDNSGSTDTLAADLSKPTTDESGLVDSMTVSRDTVMTESSGLADSITVAHAGSETFTNSAGITDSISAVHTEGTSYYFTPPTVARHLLAWPRHPLYSRLTKHVGQSVLKTSGAYVTIENPTAEAAAAADIAYLGGRVYPVTATEAAALTTAGYGAYLEPA